MTKLVYLRMDEWQRSSQNRSGKIFATSGVFIRGEPPNKKTTRHGSFLYGRSAQVIVNAKIYEELNSPRSCRAFNVPTVCTVLFHPLRKSP